MSRAVKLWLIGVWVAAGAVAGLIAVLPIKSSESDLDQLQALVEDAACSDGGGSIRTAVDVGVLRGQYVAEVLARDHGARFAALIRRSKPELTFIACENGKPMVRHLAFRRSAPAFAASRLHEGGPTCDLHPREILDLDPTRLTTYCKQLGGTMKPAASALATRRIDCPLPDRPAFDVRTPRPRNDLRVTKAVSCADVATVFPPRYVSRGTSHHSARFGWGCRVRGLTSKAFGFDCYNGGSRITFLWFAEDGPAPGSRDPTRLYYNRFGGYIPADAGADCGRVGGFFPRYPYGAMDIHSTDIDCSQARRLVRDAHQQKACKADNCRVGSFRCLAVDAFSQTVSIVCRDGQSQVAWTWTGGY